jgi:hypothetical protein
VPVRGWIPQQFEKSAQVALVKPLGKAASGFAQWLKFVCPANPFYECEQKLSMKCQAGLPVRLGLSALSQRKLIEH